MSYLGVLRYECSNFLLFAMPVLRDYLSYEITFSGFIEGLLRQARLFIPNHQ